MLTAVKNISNAMPTAITLVMNPAMAKPFPSGRAAPEEIRRHATALRTKPTIAQIRPMTQAKKKTSATMPRTIPAMAKTFADGRESPEPEVPAT